MFLNEGDLEGSSIKSHNLRGAFKVYDYNSYRSSKGRKERDVDVHLQLLEPLDGTAVRGRP